MTRCRATKGVWGSLKTKTPGGNTINVIRHRGRTEEVGQKKIKVVEQVLGN